VLENKAVLARYARAGLAEFWASPDFRLSLLGLTLVLSALAVWAARAPPRSAPVYLLLSVLGVFVANALFPHMAGAVALQAYVPGVATAIALVLPVATWVYVSTLREGYATPRGSLIAATGGVAVYAAVAGWAVAP
jgi:hypothetical protein